MPAPRGSTPTFGQQNKITGGRPLIFFVIISLVMITASFRSGTGGVLGGMRNVFQTITMPVRVAGSVALTPLRGLGNVVSNLTASQETLSELKAENERLVARNAELEEAEATAKRLQELLDIRSAHELTSMAAHIISGSADSWTSSVMLDRGTVSGVSAGMPVIDAGSVIGQIIECGPATSTVRLATDENSSIAAMVQTSRAQGMLVGSASGQLYLTLVSADISVEVGQTVVTSGLDGVFPKGLPLGRITGVDTIPGALTYTITVEPFSSTENYEEVLIITAVQEDQVANEEEVAEADSQERGKVPEPAPEKTDEAEDGTEDGAESAGEGEGE